MKSGMNPPRRQPLGHKGIAKKLSRRSATYNLDLGQVGQAKQDDRAEVAKKGSEAMKAGEKAERGPESSSEHLPLPCYCATRSG